MVISEMVYAKIHSQLKLAVRIMKKCNSLSISQVFSAEVLLKLVFIKGENTTKKLTVFWEGDFSFLFKQSGVMEGAPMAGCWTQMTSQVPSNPNHSIILFPLFCVLRTCLDTSCSARVILTGLKGVRYKQVATVKVFQDLRNIIRLQKYLHIHIQYD